MNKRKKTLQVMLIVYQNSSKKVESLDRSGVLLRRNDDFDVIKGVHSNPLARKKGSFLSQQPSEQMKQRFTQI